ncbi:TPA: hypothetical protein U2B84_000604 [Streptococcus suis]|nr:hypothetical protein [Streptococcus suis]HEM6103332.1 hypothetical protein [Streptococcus suis]
MKDNNLLQPIEKFLGEEKIDLSTKAFLQKIYCGIGISDDKISSFVDEKDLSVFALLKTVHSDPVKRVIIEETFSKMFSNKKIIDGYFKAFDKSYIKKVSFFFNEIILVILSLVVPTILQYYPFKDIPLIYAIMVSFGLVVISVIRESNILEFLALNNQYKAQVTRYYMKYIFSSDKDKGFIHLVLFPFAVIKGFLITLHSFIIQFKFHLLFYVSLVILLSIAYQQVSNILDQFNRNESHQVTSTSTIKTEENFKKVEKVLTVPSQQAGEELNIGPRTLAYFPEEGQAFLTEADNMKEFSYTAPISGEYYLELIGLKESESAWVNVYDNLEKSLTSFSTDGAILTLEAGKTYKIITKFNGTDLAIRLQLTVASEVTDISYASSVKDTVSYSTQQNIYSFTPQLDGLYHFDLEDILAGSSLDINVYDKLNNSVETVNYSNSSYQLKAGEKYTIAVKHSSYTVLSDYTLKIGAPKPVQTITDYTKVIDSIEYQNQINHYIFKAPLDGVYGFEIKDKLAYSTISVLIQNHLKEKIGEIGTFSDATTVRLEKGQEYSIYVVQEKELSPYSLTIGYAHPVRKIGLEQTVTDEMTFTNEIHEYQFIPQNSGDYKVSVENNVTDVFVFDKNGNRLSGTFDGVYTFEKDEKYTVQLVQDGKFGSYEMKLQATN